MITVINGSVIHCIVQGQGRFYTRFYFQTICNGYVLDEITATPNLTVRMEPWQRWAYTVNIVKDFNTLTVKEKP